VNRCFTVLRDSHFIASRFTPVKLRRWTSKIMFDLFAGMSHESRQAMFSSVMDVHAAGSRQIETTSLVASLVRAPSLHDALVHVDTNGLLARLSAPALGNGTFEALERKEVSNLGIPPEGGFLALPLSSRAKEVFEALRAEFRSAPPESVSPKQILRAILRADAELRAVCSSFGLTTDVLS